MSCIEDDIKIDLEVKIYKVLKWNEEIKLGRLILQAKTRKKLLYLNTLLSCFGLKYAHAKFVSSFHIKNLYISTSRSTSEYMVRFFFGYRGLKLSLKY